MTDKLHDVVNALSKYVDNGSSHKVILDDNNHGDYGLDADWVWLDDLCNQAMGLMTQMSVELERVKAERDAAVQGLRRDCATCKHFEVWYNGCTPDYDCKTIDCHNASHWEWCGVRTKNGGNDDESK